MTFNTLVSFSLLALVVTARPLLPETNETPEIDVPALDVPSPLQSVFQSHVGQPSECSNCEDGPVQVPPTPIEGKDASIASLDNTDALKALIHDSAEVQDYDGLSASLTPYSPLLPSADGLPDASSDGKLIDTDPVPSIESTSDNSDATKSPWDILAYLGLESSNFVVLILSCLLASLALTCLVGVLCLKGMLTSGASDARVTTLDPSHVEKREISDTPPSDSTYGSGNEKLGLLFLDVEVPEQVAVVVTAEDGTSNEKVHLVGGPYDHGDYASDEEDLHEKFHDAIGSLSPFMQMNRSLPRISVEYSDPDLLPLPVNDVPTPYSTPPHSPRIPLRRPQSPAMMRESTTSSPLSRPAWSLRASDSPALGIATSPMSSPLMRSISPEPVSRSGALAIPGAFETDEDTHVIERPAPRRAYRAPVPELDLAFAMQLRPGLGMGSDPAWLVRFLMAMFGWMTVLIGGNGTSRPTRRTITV